MSILELRGINHKYYHNDKQLKSKHFVETYGVIDSFAESCVFICLNRHNMALHPTQHCTHYKLSWQT